MIGNDTTIVLWWGWRPDHNYDRSGARVNVDLNKVLLNELGNYGSTSILCPDSVGCFLRAHFKSDPYILPTVVNPTWTWPISTLNLHLFHWCDDLESWPSIGIIQNWTTVTLMFRNDQSPTIRQLDQSNPLCGLIITTKQHDKWLDSKCKLLTAYYSSFNLLMHLASSD